MRRPHGEDGLLGEAPLRRALRLDADELPRRLDPAAIAAAATAQRSRRAEKVFASAAAFASAAVFASATAVAVWIALAAATGAELDASGALRPIVDAGVRLAVAAGVPVTQVASALAGPTPAIVSLAALTFAVLHERARREERGHAVAS